MGEEIWGICLGLTPWVCRQGKPVYGLRGIPPLLWVIRDQNGAWSWGAWTQRCSMWMRKFGDTASASSTFWDATGPVSKLDWEAFYDLLGVPAFKESEMGSKLGPVANNVENIASRRQSLWMQPRNLWACGRQWALSACRPGRPVWGLLGIPSLLWVLRGQKGLKVGHCS